MKTYLKTARRLAFLMLILVLSACAPAVGPVSTAEDISTAVVPVSSATATPKGVSLQEMPAENATDIPSSIVIETVQPKATSTAAGVDDTVAGFPDPSAFIWERVVSGLSQPLDLASPRDSSNRLFILEQPGVIRIFQDGSLLPVPFLDIREKVQSRGNEQGLLGIAFHPDFVNNGYFYINYTGLQGVGDSVIARYQVSPSDPNLANPQSEKVLLTVPQPYTNHNGGGLAFGPDGFLYIGLGDGGSANDPQGNGQSKDTLLGKLLRIDVDSGDPYAIPADNPFAGGGGRAEIWVYGLRNPWRFSFDSKTGDLYIADVGQNQWEEVHFIPVGEARGVNMGWNYREGTHRFAGDPPPGVDLVSPIFEYQHGANGCSITGGYVYRGQSLPEFNGIYLFSDFCSGKVWGILQADNGAWQVKELFQTGYNVTSFGIDGNHELYLMDRSSGSIFRLERK